MEESRGLVILGRDGVINELVDGGVKSPDDWKPIAQSIAAIARLSTADFRVVVATNQQALSKGELDVASLHDVHDRMLSAVREAGGTLDAIVFASGGQKEGHGRLQPKTRLISDLMQRFKATRATTTLIGDSREDMEAAAVSGIRSVLLQTGAGVRTLQELSSFDGVTVHSNLAAAADALIGASGSSA